VSVKRIALLPGDGVGPEVMGAAGRVLEALGDLDVSVHECGPSLSPATLAACRAADAVLLGPLTEESGGARSVLAWELGLFAALRAARPLRGLAARSPLTPERVAAMDVMVVAGESDPEPLVRAAFDAARRRRGHVTWQGPFEAAVERVASEHDDVACEPATVDALASRLVAAPAQLDVILCEREPARVLAQVAVTLTGVPAAQACALVGAGPGVFSPVHGPAPRVAGRPAPSPLGALLAAALLLRHGLGLDAAARRVERAVDATIAGGLRTPELVAGEAGERAANTFALTAHVLAHLRPAEPAAAG
jgi:3-isopropylmalate dehydrogenase